MLSELEITNLGVISHARAEFSPGLTVLTGETGAGKTFVLSGLRLLTGGRADSSRVREGSPSANVEGIFDIDDADEQTRTQVNDIVDEAGAREAGTEGSEVIVARSVSAKGRSRAHLGARTVTAAVLADVTAPLITVHGQHDQLRLLTPEAQLDVIDTVGGVEIAQLKATYQQHRARWRDAKKELVRRTTQARELAQEEDRLRFAVDEINAIDPQPGEDVELLQRVQHMQAHEAIHTAAAGALALLADDDDPHTQPARDQIEAAVGTLKGSGDATLESIAQRLSELSAQLQDVAGELAGYTTEVDPQADDLETVLQRQGQIKELIRKYADDIDGVRAWRDQAEERLKTLDTSTDALQQLHDDAAAAAADTKTAAAELHQLRTRLADSLQQDITNELQSLAMPGAEMTIAVTAGEAYGKHGTDTVEFLLSPHPSSPGRPLAQAASGGELSRVMLALEVVLAAGRSATTIVFDEVDAGVGGKAAIEIGRRLMRLARWCQVIVVTHLPQVAAYADSHIVVHKEATEEAVTSELISLPQGERINELARMLAGLDESDTGRAHATELWQRAQQEREALGD